MNPSRGWGPTQVTCDGRLVVGCWLLVVRVKSARVAQLVLPPGMLVIFSGYVHLAE